MSFGLPAFLFPDVRLEEGDITNGPFFNFFNLYFYNTSSCIWGPCNARNLNWDLPQKLSLALAPPQGIRKGIKISTSLNTE